MCEFYAEFAIKKRQNMQVEEEDLRYEERTVYG